MMVQNVGHYMVPGAYTGDALSMCRRLPDGSIHCSVSSPPYYKARVYHPDNTYEIGREDELALYIDSLIEIYAEITRALRDDGTIWVNLGDGFDSGSRRLMPHRFAMAMEDRLGLKLRMDVIMETSSIAPEPVRVRPIPSHQYIFMFTKGKHYYDPEMALEQNPDSVNGYRMVTSVWRMPASRVKQNQAAPFHVELPLRCILLSTPPGVCSTCGTPFIRKIERALGPDGKKLPSFKEWAESQGDDFDGGKYGETAVRMKDLSMGYGASLSRYFKEVHGGNTTKRTMVGFEPSCLCGDVDNPSQAIVLDPFLGTGTTGAAAAQCGRNWLGFDIDPDLADRVAERMSEVNTGNIASALDMGFSVWDKMIGKAGLRGIVGSEHLPGWPDVFAANATVVDPNYLGHKCDDCGAEPNWTCDATVERDRLMGNVHKARVSAGHSGVSWFRDMVTAEYIFMGPEGYHVPGIGKSPRGSKNQMTYLGFRCPDCFAEDDEPCYWLHTIDPSRGDEIPLGWGHLQRIYAAKEYANRNRS